MPNDESHQHNNFNRIDLEIASQKLRIPATYQTALITFIIVAGIVTMELKMGTLSTGITNLSNTTAGLHDPDGTVTNEINATIYEFWTPGVNTIYDIESLLHQEKMASSAKEKTYNEEKQHKKCEKLINNKKYCTTYTTLKKFGEALKNMGAQGYTRYHGWGEGSTGLKRGWTWRPALSRWLIIEKTDRKRRIFWPIVCLC
ncbi:MAG: hypothetical protein Q9N68_04425 [Gammaproteobacteria bacterium]|nr:hypothetical protein [Gammaproteobacteria bacterium]